MTPLDFLAKVLPSPGNGVYCAAAALGSTKPRHFYSQELSALIPKAELWDGQNLDTYFALSTFAKEGNRTADNACYIKSLFVDLDGYDTKKDAAEALSAFLAKTELDALGSPWLVSSGGGLHVYWPFAKAVPTPVWKPVAENLKRLFAQEGVRIDNTVTADAARVLRFPGTRNHKAKYGTPRPVKVLLEGDTFDFAQLAEHILAKLHVKPPVIDSTRLTLPGTKPQRSEKSSLQKALSQNDSTKFEPIWLRSIDASANGCAQLAHYAQHASEDGMEPLWRGILSWTKVCEDGDQYAKDISALHPYSADRTAQKLVEIKGPYPCVKMDSENPGVCTSCPHWGKITNPLVFGRAVEVDNTKKTVSVALELPDSEDALFDLEADDTEHVVERVYVRPTPPRGFSYGANGGVYVEKKEEDSDGNMASRQLPVLFYDLFVVSVLKVENEHCAQFVAMRPGSPSTMVMPTRAVVSKDDTIKFLASQNIYAAFGAGNDKNLFEYIRASVETAANERKAIEVPTQFGWRADKAFVYNGRVFTPDGKEHHIPMGGLDNLNNRTNSRGTIENWRKPWEQLILRKEHTMLALCVDSFGSTLMPFTKVSGFTWHLGSAMSGTGKSLILSLKESVWGKPGRYRINKSTSGVAMQQRAGLLNNLPMLVDEITAKARADMEWVPEFIFDIAEGQGKERMESGSNKERVNKSTWALSVTLTSNTYLTDYMSGVRAFSSNGELHRLLEWNSEKPLTFTPEERAINDLIAQHYGVAGEAWVRWTAQNYQTVKDVVQETAKNLYALFEFNDVERYWHAGCTTTIAAALLLGPKHANIITLPVKAIMEALKELVNKARAKINNNIRSADDVLNAYTREHYGQFIIMTKIHDDSGNRILAKWGRGEVIDKSLTRSKVLGRIEHEVKSARRVDYYIEEHLLRSHCLSMSFSYQTFCEQMEKKYRVKYVKKDMLQGTDGPTMRVNTMHIIRNLEDDDGISVGEA